MGWLLRLLAPPAPPDDAVPTELRSAMDRREFFRRLRPERVVAVVAAAERLESREG